ncbi:Heme A synthase [Streptomyces sp. RB5]|uniref:Heme A synthase n=1 Tax=Streptomyces smaragdinus TaxID=2585196 RepID=A0A7K0CFZ7_9ACTN|nr:COX15/CtaA family protein [Streptomyces smaragdinus]MQY12378.1 Heme A synthase [Streptomyces smaragdinus]
MFNPLALIDRRWTPSPQTVRRAAMTALVTSVVIVVTGGVVRLTGSGLGCDTWPKCSSESLTTTREMGLHGAIEFGNRLLTYVVCAAVGWAIIAARCVKPRRRGLTRLAWWQFWLVVVNAVVGGITVLMDLNPYIVAGHFLAASGLLTVAFLTWHRAGEGDGGPDWLVGGIVRKQTWLLVAATVVLLVAGTIVTGAGPHAGDSSEVPRIEWISWTDASHVHAASAWLVVSLTLVIWVTLKLMDGPPGPLARVRELFLVLMAQGVIGYVQYFTDVPEVLVGVHMLGTSLVWIAVLRVLMSLRHRPSVTPADIPQPAAESHAVAAGS